MLSVNIGLNTGQLKIISEEFDKVKRFFCPQITLYNSYRIKRFSTSISASYFYDITNKNWDHTFINNKKNDNIALSPFSNRGFNLSFGIGYYY